jgi:tRNA(fMet)-specific endonuclease VapC
VTALRTMLDTNIVSDLVKNPSGRVARKLREVGDQGLGVSVIVAAELRFGYAKRGSPVLTRQVEAVLSALLVAPFDQPADAECADIRNQLERSGRMIGPNDLLIAAHARSLGVPLVTQNSTEFARVAGLKVENWLE